MSSKDVFWNEIKSKILKIKAQLPYSGVRKMYVMLKPELEKIAIKIGRDGLFAIVKSMGLLIKRKRYGKKTTDSNHAYKKHPNLLKEMEVTKPNQVFVSDITYISCAQKHLYLSLITDMYSRKIVGYELSDNLRATGPIKAMKMALKGVEKPAGLIHHSDRGVQYCCKEYISILEKANIKISMTEENHVYENALAERVNGILKWEFGLKERFKNKEEANRVLSEAIYLYNKVRPHLSLNYNTPDKVYSNVF